MILQFLQKQFVLHHMRKLQGAIDQEVRLQQERDPGALERGQKTGITIQELKNAQQQLSAARARMQDHPDDEPVFITRDAITSLTQSVLQRHVVVEKPELIAHNGFVASSLVPFTKAVLRSAGNEIVDLFSHFGPYDAGWLSCKVAQGVRDLEGRRPFNRGPAPINTISNKARLVLLSDWGTGVPRARDVAASARRYVEEALNQHRDVHVLHLGDVYYAGYKFEYDDRFLAYWPVHKDEEDTISSYALNGNHDMYSGGHDYFDYLLADPRFRLQHKCSFFGLENAFWQILALDTAYEECTLAAPQAQWVFEKRNEARQKAGILLSHHQPFSPFREAATHLLEVLKPVTDRQLITAWWWGHEHRCILYEPRPDVQYCRCIGYGGVPVFADRGPNPPGVAYQYRDVVPDTDPPFARFGFAVMDFDNEKLHVAYLRENGVPHQEETIVSTAATAQPVGQT